MTDPPCGHPVDVLWIKCGNCGNMFPHDAPAAEKWLSQNPWSESYINDLGCRIGSEGARVFPHVPTFPQICTSSPCGQRSAA
jgi:hypothetical protein